MNFWVNGVRKGAGHEAESELTMLARLCPRAAWLGEHHCTMPGSTPSSFSSTLRELWNKYFDNVGITLEQLLHSGDKFWTVLTVALASQNNKKKVSRMAALPLLALAKPHKVSVVETFAILQN